ncbi:MAG: hypothetical protein HUU25_07850 [Candidatus Sumerlaeia bacterium]|nr:hypothetical protein [Candidatus Sumerlaeia bacterium]
MKRLISWILGLVVILVALTLFANWREESNRRARQRADDQRRAEALAQEQREQLLAAPAPPVQGTPNPNLPVADPQNEYRFRQLAEEHRVEVLEYRAVARREIVVALRTRSQTGIGDLLDAAIREGILLDFDDDMQSRNARTTVDPSSGAHIWHTRFTFREG